MLETIAPERVAIDARSEFCDDGLFPEERECLGVVVEKRLREFTTGRACARKALLKLGISPCPIRIGPRREPIWPKGIVGSITHCSGYCAAAVVRSLDLCSIGIDAEENLPLGEGVLEVIASPQERTEIRTLGGSGLHWDRLLFSAKESVFKAWYHLTNQWLDFSECDILWGPEGDLESVGEDLIAGIFVAHLSRSWSSSRDSQSRDAHNRFEGRFVFGKKHLATMVTVPTSKASLV
jgi:4'-phosphopantetheinyl transferase EntD